jgi:trehalose utilization protein
MGIHVTVWNEYYHERFSTKVEAVYPEGIHKAIAGFLSKEPDITVSTATLEEPEHGLMKEVLENTDVLVWWGHVKHSAVSDEVALRVVDRVNKGMGLIVLHSAHLSKPFKMLMGTTCTLRWHEVGEKERIWTVEPCHPVTQGLPTYFEIPNEEMYGERFDIPVPDSLVFLGWFQSGELFRSGCCFQRGYGKIFYFQPGHETYPVYYNANVQKIIINAVRWAKADLDRPIISCQETACLEPVHEQS